MLAYANVKLIFPKGFRYFAPNCCRRQAKWPKDQWNVEQFIQICFKTYKNVYKYKVLEENKLTISLFGPKQQQTFQFEAQNPGKNFWNLSALNMNLNNSKSCHLHLSCGNGILQTNSLEESNRLDLKVWFGKTSKKISLGWAFNDG